MRILSFRGPYAPGGVSSALSQIYENENSEPEWWFIDQQTLKRKLDGQSEVNYPLDPQISREHYLYCNNFLWPVMHDMPHLAHFSEQERRSYAAFNLSVAFQIKCAENINPTNLFFNDYQFAVGPTFLNLNRSSEITFFWHIPRPKIVIPHHVEAITELAKGLLRANAVGFHTKEYLYNFLSFVEQHLPEYRQINRQGKVLLTDKFTLNAPTTVLFASPLGLDATRWQALSRLGSINQEEAWPRSMTCILSVDRADYTKGILERLEAISHFLASRPEWHGKVNFVQLITRSREGLAVFDEYFEKCRTKATEINSRFASENWEPLIWLDKPKSAIELAGMYRRADVMLVSPTRDGLNLTAKEYVACKNSRPGVLALSPGAGTWSELGRSSVEVITDQPEAFAKAIEQSLTMSDAEKRLRMQSLRSALAENSLDKWWHNMRRIIIPEENIELLERPRIDSRANR